MTKAERDYKLIVENGLLKEWYPTLSGKSWEEDKEEFQQIRFDRYGIEKEDNKEHPTT